MIHVRLFRTESTLSLLIYSLIFQIQYYSRIYSQKGEPHQYLSNMCVHCYAFAVFGIQTIFFKSSAFLVDACAYHDDKRTFIFSHDCICNLSVAIKHAHCLALQMSWV
jgi:hypothetical protein